MQRHRLAGIVEAHFRFDAERAGKNVRAASAAGAERGGVTLGADRAGRFS
jgi:hypothetical protein